MCRISRNSSQVQSQVNVFNPLTTSMGRLIDGPSNRKTRRNAADNAAATAICQLLPAQNASCDRLRTTAKNRGRARVKCETPKVQRDEQDEPQSETTREKGRILHPALTDGLAKVWRNWRQAADQETVGRESASYDQRRKIRARRADF